MNNKKILVLLSVLLAVSIIINIKTIRDLKIQKENNNRFLKYVVTAVNEEICYSLEELEKGLNQNQDIKLAFRSAKNHLALPYRFLKKMHYLNSNFDYNIETFYMDYLLLLNPDNMTEHDRQVMKEIIKIGKEFRISSYGERSMWIWEEPEKNRLLPTKKTLDNYKKIEELSRKAIKELNPTARK